MVICTIQIQLSYVIYYNAATAVYCHGTQDSLIKAVPLLSPLCLCSRALR
jgi:hypothetical protein